ncbi:hypothetical protein [Streptomyces spectabilis]|uniref:Uncharacterized protein n=1 Tax=Streptomyces spectabilis TaxID=68270 RepID=A0A7W8B6T9_STRST|nr:hypothetical protein [Streptomyces spectabilis]MBB5109643.1 hypothetical protein [Streptomyces spectabilis]GGV54894.1 hypothetical protein GCM10010245_86840 [Streptomyces spectabilis]
MVADLVMEDLDEVLSLRAIMCVTGPDALHYTRAVTRAVCVLPETGPAVLWVDAKAPGDRTAMVEALYRGLCLDGIHGPRPRRLADAEEMIVAELSRTPRLVVVLGAHALRTEALEMLYAMWKHLVPGQFAWVLTGQSGKLEQVLQRPALASLTSYVFLRHRAGPEPA